MFQLYAGTMLFYLYVPRCVFHYLCVPILLSKKNLSHENTFFLSSQGIHLNLYDFIVQFIMIFTKKWISISIQLRTNHWIETKRKKKEYLNRNETYISNCCNKYLKREKIVWMINCSNKIVNALIVSIYYILLIFFTYVFLPHHYL